MKTPLCFWCAVLLCLCSLFLLISGASLIQSRTANGGEPVLSPTAHKILAEAVGVFAVVLALVLTFIKTAKLAVLAAWISVALVVADAVAGSSAPAASHLTGFFHSLLAQFFVASTAVIAAAVTMRPVASSIPDKGWPSLRGYALFTCVLVVFQVMLGAGFRHELVGIMWHIIGALLLALFLLGLAMMALNLPKEVLPSSNPLKAPAVVLTVLAGTQITLGLTVASLRSGSPGMTAMTISHAAIASLTLASTVVLTVLARHHLAKRAAA